MTRNQCILHSALLLLAVLSPCAAQEMQAGSQLKQVSSEVSKQLAARSYGHQTDAFRRLLFELRFQPLSQFADLHDNPSESLLIVLGDPSCLSKEHFPKGLLAFLQEGGAVLIATDMKAEGEAGKYLRDVAGVAVTGEKLVCPGMDKLYELHPDCPLLQPIAQPRGSGGAADVFGALAAIAGVGSRPALFRNPRSEKDDLIVATNAPSRLKESVWWMPVGVHRLARLPKGCLNESDISLDSPTERQMELLLRVQAEEPLFAVGGSRGKGRVLVLADHSIFINRMMLPSNNNNLEFAANCLHWLRGGVSTPMEALRAARSQAEPGNEEFALKQLTGQRNKVLFWDDGRIRNNFEVPLKTVPLKPSLASEPAIVAAIDKTLANMEDNDFFNRQLLEGMDDLAGGRQRVFRYVVYVLTLAAFLLVGYRFLWRSRHQTDLAIPALTEAVSRHEPRLSLLEQRRRAVLRSGNVWETVHRLARECFESAGFALSAAAPPRLEMKQSNWRQRWRLHRRVARLWQLARGDAPVPIPPAALQHWLHELEELKSALRDGTIHPT